MANVPSLPPLGSIERVEALAGEQSRILEMVARGEPLRDILEALLHFIESQAPEMLCSVLLLDEDGVHIRHGASPSLPARARTVRIGIEKVRSSP